jgi:membrane protease YdiL (CAAX protease family)
VTPPRPPRAAAEAQPPFTFAFAALLTVLTNLIFLFVFGNVLEGSGGAYTFAYGLAVTAAYANAFVIAGRRVPPPLHAAIGLAPVGSAGWLAPFLLAPSIVLISELDNWIVPAVFGAARRGEPVPDVPLLTGLETAMTAFVFVVLEPIGRESFFRGLVQGRLAALWSGPRAILATTLLYWASLVLLPQDDWGYAAVKLTIAQVPLALLLGALRQCSGSLYPPMLLAALIAGVNLLSAQQRLGIPGLDDVSSPHTPAAWLVPCALLTGAGLWLCYRMALPPAQQPGEHRL